MATVRRVFMYLAPHRRWLYINVFAMLLLVAVGLVEPQVLRRLFDTITEEG